MPYPDPPEIQTSYTAQEQALGNGTLPGQELDVDLAAVRASITAIIEFMKVFTRSDGRLANGSVTSDTLASSLIIGFDPPAPWVTGQAYTTRSTVFQGFGFYLCVQEHTSGTFATDLASGRWVLLADLTPPGGALVASNNLSDVPDKAVARSNLQLGTMATANSGTGSAQHRTNSQNEAFFQPLAAPLTSWAALTRASGFDTFAATPSSANLRALLTDESGSGALLFAGGAMGTPSSLVLTNATGLPFAGLDAAAVITAGETIAANNNDTSLPTSAAVKAYADAAAQGTTVGLLTTTGATTVGPWTLPAGVKRFTVTSNKSSLGGAASAAPMLVQLRVAGSFVVTGYTSRSTSGSGNISDTTGMVVSLNNPVNYWDGAMDFWLHDPATNLWLCRHTGTVDNSGADNVSGSGSIALAGSVDGVRISSTGGRTFDVSSFNVHY